MKIICVGMNYRLHNKELGETLLEQENPVIFMKPDSSMLRNRRPFFLPDFSERIEYETELVVRISRLGKSIEAKFADRYWDAVTLGIDFTARDLQNQYRSKGLPWELCKGFDSSAVVGDWIEKEALEKELQDLNFRLDIDGKTVQQGYTGDMIFSVARIIEYVSSFCTLKTGDLIFTGTPVGVGPVHIGEHLQGYLEDKNVLDFHIR
ncbi:MAG: fumarylacetoacetate hydrolase family protein [Bacteroidaceae bacterium]|jgi:2-keto-4-pentenoate hydratase/2-oxohepta-3-ene-1,7-dioic acid hydratase in catechol pathway|nr:fumarylacetoacetate hydrolase family protein [Bacteroidaceae bacterium]MBR4302365.1 fumarylacetoacetate hydrolase family protein [Bacteroidaceae bacterium]